MVQQLGATIIDSIDSFFRTFADLLTADALAYVVAGAFGVLLIYGILRVVYSYELRALRAIKSINKYLIANPKIMDSNLIEFNVQMRKLPRRMRDRWQMFMLDRDGTPSKYMTGEYCVERPLRYSSITNFLKQFKTIIIIISLLTLVLATAFAIGNMSINLFPSAFAYITSLPASFIVLCLLFSMIVQARYNYLTNDLAENYSIFMRNVDKATLTLPDYVDYEQLFTKKEIREGIPVLREYLEKREREEQRLIEEAKKAAVDYSPYSFDDLGINGALLLERAVFESEAFLLNRIRLQNEIADLNKELERSKRSFEDIEKEGQRKLQTIKENLERLKKQADESTNRIEVNYIRKQEAEELKKQQYIERDLEGYKKKAEDEQNNFLAEIQRRKEDVEKQRKGVEDALKSEYNTFSGKVYDALNAKIAEDNAELVQNYEDHIARYKAKLKELAVNIDRKESVIEARNLEIDNLRMMGKSGSAYSSGRRNNNDKRKEENIEETVKNEAYYASHEEPAPQAENLINVNAQQHMDEDEIDYSQYYDENGNLIDFSTQEEQAGDYEDYSQYYDENGNLIDYSQYYDENGSLIGGQEEAESQLPEAAEIESYDLNPDEAAEQPPQVAIEESLAQIAKIPEQYEVASTDKYASSLMSEHIAAKAAKPAAKPVPKKQPDATKMPKTGTARKSTARAKITPSSTGRRLAVNKIDNTKTSKIDSELDDLAKLQKAIEHESSNLVKQQQELRKQISTSLAGLDADKNVTKQERNRYLKQIKSLIEDLKIKAKDAKENGAPKEELNAINKSIMELLNLIAKYSSEGKK